MLLSFHSLLETPPSLCVSHEFYILSPFIDADLMKRDASTFVRSLSQSRLQYSENQE